VQNTEPAFLQKIRPKVTQTMNEKLMAPFSAKDAKKTAFSIGDYKAPGPDGPHAGFYKNFRNIRGNEITQDVSNAINSR
jgi:hypothetical protein